MISSAYFRPETWAWTPFFRTVPLSSVAGIYLLLRVGLSTTRFRFDLRTFLLVCFLSLALISGLNSRWFDRSTGMFMDVSKAFLVTYLLALLTDSASKLRIVLQTIALSLGFESAKQAWVQLLTSPGSQNDNPIVFGRQQRRRGRHAHAGADVHRARPHDGLEAGAVVLLVHGDWRAGPGA